MAKYTINDTTLTSIADAIRAKGGTTAALTPSQMPEAIAAIEAGGGGGGDDLALSIIDRSITDITDNKTKEVGILAFAACYSLRNAEFAECGVIGQLAFSSCNSLSQISFPKCSEIRISAFNSCTALLSVNFPACKSVFGSAFNQCSSLSIASFPVCNRISTYAFRSCASLSAFVLGGSSVCSLYGSNAFSRTLIASGTGYIYVPASLVDAYKTATNWTYYSAQISAIEDSEFA